MLTSRPRTAQERVRPTASPPPRARHGQGRTNRPTRPRPVTTHRNQQRRPPGGQLLTSRTRTAHERVRSRTPPPPWAHDGQGRAKRPTRPKPVTTHRNQQRRPPGGQRLTSRTRTAHERGRPKAPPSPWAHDGQGRAERPTRPSPVPLKGPLPAGAVAATRGNPLAHRHAAGGGPSGPHPRGPHKGPAGQLERPTPGPQHTPTRKNVGQGARSRPCGPRRPLRQAAKRGLQEPEDVAGATPAEGKGRSARTAGGAKGHPQHSGRVVGARPAAPLPPERRRRRRKGARPHTLRGAGLPKVSGTRRVARLLPTRQPSTPGPEPAQTRGGARAVAVPHLTPLLVMQAGSPRHRSDPGQNLSEKGPTRPPSGRARAGRLQPPPPDPRPAPTRGPAGRP